MTCYMGNIHVNPIARLWKTNKLDKLTQKITTTDNKEINVFTQHRKRGSSNAPVTTG